MTGHLPPLAEDTVRLMRPYDEMLAKLAKMNGVIPSTYVELLIDKAWAEEVADVGLKSPNRHPDD